jgi:hypothetical protein
VSEEDRFNWVEMDRERENLSYPIESSFKKINYWHNDKIVFSRFPHEPKPDHTVVWSVLETVFQKDEYTKAIHHYFSDLGRLWAKFEELLFEYLEVTDHPKRYKLFEMAQQSARFNCFVNIAEKAEYLAQLIKD